MTDAIATEGIRQTIDKVAGFLDKVAGPPLEELGGLLADPIRAYRVKRMLNLGNIIDMTEAFLKKKGIKSPQNIALKVLFPILENSSLEEEEDMQKKWAALLANAADLNLSHAMDSTYVDLLRQISPVESIFLDLLFEKVLNEPMFEEASDITDKITAEIGPVTIHDFITENNLSKDDMQILMTNLLRLRLIQHPLTHGTWEGTSNIDTEKIRFTPLGYSFVENCREK